MPPQNPEKKRHELLADALPHLVWTLDTAGVPTYFNQRWTDYTGLDLAETLRVGGRTFIHPDDLPEIEHLSKEAMARGAPFDLSYRLRARDGTHRWHTAHLAPLREHGLVI
ncbi:MAG: PAS domain-containing protein, partial [Minicystis sp.]